MEHVLSCDQDPNQHHCSEHSLHFENRKLCLLVFLEGFASQLPASCSLDPPRHGWGLFSVGILASCRFGPSRYMPSLGAFIPIHRTSHLADSTGASRHPILRLSNVLILFHPQRF